MTPVSEFFVAQVPVNSRLVTVDLSTNGRKSYKNPEIFRVAHVHSGAGVTAKEFLAVARKSISRFDRASRKIEGLISSTPRLRAGHPHVATASISHRFDCARIPDRSLRCHASHSRTGRKALAADEGVPLCLLLRGQAERRQPAVPGAKMEFGC
jgi:hypothetical protein